MKHLVFVGGGHMAKALHQSFAQSPVFMTKNMQLSVVEPQLEAHSYWHDTNIATVECLTALNLSAVDGILLAFKPQNLASFAQTRGIVDALKNYQGIMISILAGAPLAKIAETLNFPINKIARAMPNLACAIGQGVSALYAKNEQTRTIAKPIFTAGGACIDIEDEAQMHAFTAIAGSGPAYVYHVMTASLDMANHWGLDQNAMRMIIAQLFAGAANIALHDNNTSKSFEELQAQVTSKNGTTEAALNCFKAEKLQTIWQQGLQAAYDRSIVLSHSEKK